MDLVLKRQDKSANGIFSTLSKVQDDGSLEIIAVTLEHAYPAGMSSWVAKIKIGAYLCVRGMHSLHDKPAFDTFEVTGVPGHTGILFHVGNFNKDSEGCILLGERRDGDAIINSREAFGEFMALQAGVNNFKLTVE